MKKDRENSGGGIQGSDCKRTDLQSMGCRSSDKSSDVR